MKSLNLTTTGINPGSKFSPHHFHEKRLSELRTASLDIYSVYEVHL